MEWQWFRAAVLGKYMTFRGRARRREYWNYVLFYFLLYLGLLLIDALTGTFSIETEMGFLSGLFTLLTLLPTIAVAVRRLHDTDRSGWWLLLGVVPLLGAIVLLYFTVQEGDAGDNEYGADPKSVPANAPP
jgi:uncharacterized membrane protein YhaH (DUF805 family)